MVGVVSDVALFLAMVRGVSDLELLCFFDGCVSDLGLFSAMVRGASDVAHF